MSCRCTTPEKPDKKSGRGKVWNAVAGSLVLLIPKCAMCWSAYLGLLGWTGINVPAYRPWFVPVAVSFFCFTLCRLLWRAFQTGRFLAFFLALAAAGVIAWEKTTTAEPAITVLALSLMIFSWMADLHSGGKRAGIMFPFLFTTEKNSQQTH